MWCFLQDLTPGVGDVLSALPSRDTADPQSWATEHVRSSLCVADQRLTLHCLGLHGYKHFETMFCGVQVLFPAIRSKLIPAVRRAKDGSIVRLVSLKTLYKVFERC